MYKLTLINTTNFDFELIKSLGGEFPDYNTIKQLVETIQIGPTNPIDQVYLDLQKYDVALLNDNYAISLFENSQSNHRIFKTTPQITPHDYKETIHFLKALKTINAKVEQSNTDLESFESNHHGLANEKQKIIGIFYLDGKNILRDENNDPLDMEVITHAIKFFSNHQYFLEWSRPYTSFNSFHQVRKLVLTTTTTKI